jgi:predicted AAA+ superfamily ATPase
MQSVLKPQYICRKTYIERAFHYVGHPVIKVLTGQRRTGKSYLLWQMMDAIKQKSPKSNIVFVSKELYEFDAIRDYHDLVAFAKKNLKQKVDNFLFIDEVQEIAQFEKAIRSLLAEGRYDIWCSGSNASLLSGDLATLLGGRTMEIRVSGLSYAEFIEFHKLTDSKDTLDKFLKFGGLPYLRNLQLDDDIVYDYLRSIYASILYKDVVARHQLRNIIFLENLVRYAASCTGSLLSAKKNKRLS